MNDFVEDEKKNEAAFPGRQYQSREWWKGMTLRDYFAAKAMASLCTHEQNMIAIAADQGARQEIADDAYGMADAMMKAREK